MHLFVPLIYICEYEEFKLEKYLRLNPHTRKSDFKNFLASNSCSKLESKEKHGLDNGIGHVLKLQIIIRNIKSFP